MVLSERIWVCAISLSPTVLRGCGLPETTANLSTGTRHVYINEGLQNVYGKYI